MRMPVPAVSAALAAGLALAVTPVVLPGPAAHAAADVFVELNPSTVPAGDEFTVRASCTDLKPATVSAEPIGEVTVQVDVGFLTAKVEVPEATEPGDYPVLLTCPDAGGTATATLHVVAKVEPVRGPATGGGGTARTDTAPILVGGGLAAIVAGLALGLLALRRRRLG